MDRRVVAFRGSAHLLNPPPAGNLCQKLFGSVQRVEAFPELSVAPASVVSVDVLPLNVPPLALPESDSGGLPSRPPVGRWSPVRLRERSLRESPLLVGGGKPLRLPVERAFRCDRVVPGSDCVVLGRSLFVVLAEARVLRCGATPTPECGAFLALGRRPPPLLLVLQCKALDHVQLGLVFGSQLVELALAYVALWPLLLLLLSWRFTVTVVVLLLQKRSESGHDI